VTLEEAELWRKFKEVTNEMIVTKSGRWAWVNYHFIPLFNEASQLRKIQILNDGLHQTRTTLSQLCAARLPITAGCDTARIRTKVSVVKPPALKYSALDRCATREPQIVR
jgi:hypothetical protein